MKTKTREQVEAMKDKAARFARDVLGDDQKADEFDAMSVGEYAERKRIALANPRKVTTMAKSLRQQVQELQEENAELRETVTDFEARFDDIASSLPEAEEAEDGEDQGEDEDES